MPHTPPWARDIDDLLHVPDRVMAVAVPRIDPSMLAMALKSSSKPLREKVLGFFDQKAADNILEEIEFMGPVRLSDVENAQQRVVDIVNSVR